MSNQSDYDRRVKDILDRVAKGHLSTEEGATLIAAIQPAAAGDDTGKASDAGTTAEPGGPVANGPVADGGASTGKTGWPSADELPSPSVWAEVVDSPDADVPAGKHAAPNAADADADAPKAEADATAGPNGSATVNGADASAAPTAAGGNEVQDSVVDDAPAADTTPAEEAEAEVEAEVDAEDVEEEHSHVPMPAGVQRVTVRAIGRRVRLIGEPAINGVAVDGPHVIKRDGDTLAISSEGDMGVSIDGFSMLRNPTNLKSHVNGLAKELSIRVNPSLQVEVEVTGGSVHAERLPGLTRVRVTAGTAKVTDVSGPIDLLVQAGSASLDAQITKGRSRVRVESGAANVNLRRGSDVRVHTESQLGRVSWAGAVTGQSKDVEIGRGRAALDVEVLVGTAQIISD
jgi:hypothetical protein